MKSSFKTGTKEVQNVKMMQAVGEEEEALVEEVKEPRSFSPEAARRAMGGGAKPTKSFVTREIHTKVHTIRMMSKIRDMDSKREKSTLDQGMEWYGIKNFTHETKNSSAYDVMGLFLRPLWVVLDGVLSMGPESKKNVAG